MSSRCEPKFEKLDAVCRARLAPRPDAGEALDQQRTETSIPVGATAPANEPHGLGGLCAGEHAAGAEPGQRDGGLLEEAHQSDSNDGHARDDEDR